MPTSSSLATSPILTAAVTLLQHSIPVVPILPNSKAPCPRPADNAPWVITEPEDAPMVLEQCRRKWGGVGLAMSLAPVSCVVCVDVDKDTPETRAWLAEHGIPTLRELPVWVCRTPRGGLHVHLYWDSDWGDPKRAVKVDGLPIDLLCKGTAIVPPTPGYAWLRGHSVEDIGVGGLAAVPDLLAARWVQGTVPRGPETGKSGGDDWLARVLAQTIAEGSRNDTLTRVAGLLHRKMPDGDGEAMLLTVNRGCCMPPLPERDVRAIWASIVKREGYRATGIEGHGNERQLFAGW